MEGTLEEEHQQAQQTQQQQQQPQQFQQFEQYQRQVQPNIQPNQQQYQAPYQYVPGGEPQMGVNPAGTDFIPDPQTGIAYPSQQYCDYPQLAYGQFPYLDPALNIGGFMTMQEGTQQGMPVFERSASAEQTQGLPQLAEHGSKVKRTRFSNQQKSILEHEYEKRSSAPYLDSDELAGISESTGLTQKQVKKWFQNRNQRVKRESKQEKE